MSLFDPNDNSTVSNWFVTLNHPGKPEHGKRYRVHNIMVLGRHKTQDDKYGIQVWGFASPTGAHKDKNIIEFDTGWGDKLEQEITNGRSMA